MLKEMQLPADQQLILRAAVIPLVLVLQGIIGWVIMEAGVCLMAPALQLPRQLLLPRLLLPVRLLLQQNLLLRLQLPRPPNLPHRLLLLQRSQLPLLPLLHLNLNRLL